MSVATASMRGHVSNTSSSQGKQGLNPSSAIEYVASKKRKEDSYSSKAYKDDMSDVSASPPQNDGKIPSPLSNNSSSNGQQGSNSSMLNNGGVVNCNSNHSTTSNSNSAYNPMSSLPNGGQYPSNGMLNGPLSSMQGQHNGMDTAGPLPNEIFELLNEFWRPNEMVAPSDAHNMINGGKFARRSPDGSLDDAVEEEKDGEDDLTSLADTEMGVDRTTQKRRYSRLSDGYERLKSVLPTVKDKRRVSKARILDEAINYIQRLESITSVLKREHEKRLSMLNGNNGFFPDYSVQPYMRSLFQKQVYPPSGMSSTSKMSNYSKMNSPNSSIQKSPRMKQYNQSYSSPSSSMSVSGSNMSSGAATDYNYNNIGNGYTSSPMYNQSGGTDPSQLMNGDSSPINNASPYSACSLSPGATPTTYQNGVSSSGVNNSWPYQGTGLSYNDSSSQLSSYNQSRQSPNTTASYSNSANPYSALNGSMWGSMAASASTINDSTSQMGHSVTEHSMKVG